MTLCEFLSLRHKDRPEYPSHSLDDVLRANVFPLLLHVKQNGRATDRVADKLRQYGALDRSVIGLMDADDAAWIRDRTPGARILGFMEGPDEIERFAKAGANYIRLWEAWLTKERVERIHDAGCEVWVMTGGCSEEECGNPSPDALRRIRSMDVDGILINDVRMALE